MLGRALSRGFRTLIRASEPLVVAPHARLDSNRCRLTLALLHLAPLPRRHPAVPRLQWYVTAGNGR